MNIVFCGNQKPTSQGIATCQRPEGHQGYHYLCPLIDPDGGKWLARWFGVVVDLTPIGARSS